jgi:hypothetical protein
MGCNDGDVSCLIQNQESTVIYFLFKSLHFITYSG